MKFDKDTGLIVETKPAVKSLTIWAGLATIAVGLIEVFPEIAQELLPVLPPHVAGVVTVVAGVVVVLRRKYASNPQIEGIISDD